MQKAPSADLGTAPQLFWMKCIISRSASSIHQGALLSHRWLAPKCQVALYCITISAPGHIPFLPSPPFHPFHLNSFHSFIILPFHIPSIPFIPSFLPFPFFKFWLFHNFLYNFGRHFLLVLIKSSVIMAPVIRSVLAPACKPVKAVASWQISLWAAKLAECFNKLRYLPMSVSYLIANGFFKACGFCSALRITQFCLPVCGTASRMVSWLSPGCGPSIACGGFFNLFCLYATITSAS